MDVFVNDAPFAPPPDAATVRDVVTAVQGGDGDRMVVALRLDGREVAPEALDAALAAAVGSASRLDIEVASARKLAAQTLGEAANVLEEARDRYVRIAELLACDKAEEAMALLEACFAAWTTAQQSLEQSSRAAGLSLDALGPEIPPAGPAVARLDAVLRGVQQGLAGRDYVAVADLVEYDLAEVTDTWQRMLVGLQQHLA